MVLQGTFENGPLIDLSVPDSLGISHCMRELLRIGTFKNMYRQPLTVRATPLISQSPSFASADGTYYSSSGSLEYRLACQLLNRFPVIRMNTLREPFNPLYFPGTGNMPRGRLTSQTGERIFNDRFTNSGDNRSGANQ
jgi:hypothetical protein